MGRDRLDDVRCDRWAEFRFSIVGRLLSSPPPNGELGKELCRLAETEWRHPVTGRPVRFAFSTIERWYYRALRSERDRFGTLRRKPRSDGGTRRAVTGALATLLATQHREHPSWSYQLHADNLAASIEADPSLGEKPSYSSVRRFLLSHGLFKHPRPRRTPGAERAAARFAKLEVRSYEVDAVNALWHFDFHEGRRPVLLPDGRWEKPVALGLLDDCSRLGCHIQWYLAETAENLVHGFAQGVLKRRLPAGALSDNGAAMLAEEFQAGLLALGITHETTLPYSPYQNGKQEAFWAQLEGRLMAMLENLPDLTLATLNEATQAWVEMEYNRSRHDEIGESPYERFVRGPDVGRTPPSAHELRLAFTRRESRSQRRSDGTISIEGRRFEIPSRFGHLTRVSVSYARWDLSFVHLVDPRTGIVLERIYPQDKLANADRRRRTRQTPLPARQHATESETPRDEIAPLLRAYMADYAATGLPPAYLPKDERPSTEEDRS
jgi:transposase InsO family protein